MYHQLSFNEKVNADLHMLAHIRMLAGAKPTVDTGSAAPTGLNFRKKHMQDDIRKVEIFKENQRLLNRMDRIEHRRPSLGQGSPVPVRGDSSPDMLRERGREDEYEYDSEPAHASNGRPRFVAPAETRRRMRQEQIDEDNVRMFRRVSNAKPSYSRDHILNHTRQLQEWSSKLARHPANKLPSYHGSMSARSSSRASSRLGRSPSRASSRAATRRAMDAYVRRSPSPLAARPMSRAHSRQSSGTPRLGSAAGVSARGRQQADVTDREQSLLLPYLQQFSPAKLNVALGDAMRTIAPLTMHKLKQLHRGNSRASHRRPYSSRSIHSRSSTRSGRRPDSAAWDALLPLTARAHSPAYRHAFGDPYMMAALEQVRPDPMLPRAAMLPTLAGSIHTMRTASPSLPSGRPSSRGMDAMGRQPSPEQYAPPMPRRSTHALMDMHHPSMRLHNRPSPSMYQPNEPMPSPQYQQYQQSPPQQEAREEEMTDSDADDEEDMRLLQTANLRLDSSGDLSHSLSSSRGSRGRLSDSLRRQPSQAAAANSSATVRVNADRDITSVPVSSPSRAAAPRTAAPSVAVAPVSSPTYPITASATPIILTTAASTHSMVAVTPSAMSTTSTSSSSHTTNTVTSAMTASASSSITADTNRNNIATAVSASPNNITSVSSGTVNASNNRPTTNTPAPREGNQRVSAAVVGTVSSTATAATHVAVVTSSSHVNTNTSASTSTLSSSMNGRSSSNVYKDANLGREVQEYDDEEASGAGVGRTSRTYRDEEDNAEEEDEDDYDHALAAAHRVNGMVPDRDAPLIRLTATAGINSSSSGTSPSSSTTTNVMPAVNKSAPRLNGNGTVGSAAPMVVTATAASAPLVGTMTMGSAATSSTATGPVISASQATPFVHAPASVATIVADGSARSSPSASPSPILRSSPSVNGNGNGNGNSAMSLERRNSSKGKIGSRSSLGEEPLSPMSPTLSSFNLDDLELPDLPDDGLSNGVSSVPRLRRGSSVSQQPVYFCNQHGKQSHAVLDAAQRPRCPQCHWVMRVLHVDVVPPQGTPTNVAPRHLSRKSLSQEHVAAT